MFSFLYSPTIIALIRWTFVGKVVSLLFNMLYGARLSDFTFTFHFHALEKEMATHSSILAFRILAAIYGVAQSWTRLKQLISSSMWDPSHSTRGRTHVPHAGRQTLNHWTTKEVPGALALMSGRHLQFWVCDCAYTVKTGDKTVPPWSCGELWWQCERNTQHCCVWAHGGIFGMACW